MGRQDTAMPHLPSFVSDTLPILDGSNDGCDGGRPTERQASSVRTLRFTEAYYGVPKDPTLTQEGPAPLL